jgi:two-component sensor histidine kinase
MLDELNHRVKNALATVQSIAVQSFREPVDPGRARQAFEARLQSLAGAHGMLSERKWEDAELGALVRQGLDAHGAERHEVRGPYVVVNSKAAIALALALHELSTNAARHGALSGGAGRVSVEWRIESERTLVINWQESGGPPVAQPQPGGFGARLIERVVRGELSGDYAVAYETSGFGATIRIPAAAYLPGEEGYGF